MQFNVTQGFFGKHIHDGHTLSGLSILVTLFLLSDQPPIIYRTCIFRLLVCGDVETYLTTNKQELVQKIKANIKTIFECTKNLDDILGALSAKVNSSYRAETNGRIEQLENCVKTLNRS